MIRLFLCSLLFCVCASAQTTPFRVNGVIRNNPNLKDTATLTWLISGSDVNGTVVIANDSIALGTKTTGNYAAGDAEAGAALTGDSATAFFSSGTIEDARLPSTITRDTEWDTIGEIETATGVNILTSTEGDAAYVPVARTITAGNGMSGGGDLSANRTLTWAPNTWSSGTLTIGDGSQASIAQTWNLSGTDVTLTASSGALAVTGTLATTPGSVTQSALRVNRNDGVAAAQLGTYPGSATNYAGLWLANVSPAAGNYTVIGDGLDTLINAPHAVGRIYFRVNNVTYLQTTSSESTFTGNLLFGSDRTYNIGAAGASRPLGIYAGTLTLANPTANTTTLDVSGGSTTGSGTTKGGTFSHTANTSGNIDGVWTFSLTDTASGASTFHTKWLGGAAGTTVLMSLDKSGNVITGAGISAPSSTVTAGGGFTASSVWTINSANSRHGSGVYVGWSSAANNSSLGDTGFNRASAGTVKVISGDHTSTTAGNLIVELEATGAVAPTIASAATIAPTKRITFISGTTTIDTITAPSPISATGGQITLIPTGVWATSTSGNIALITTAVVNKALTLFYDQATAKWYPSY